MDIGNMTCEDNTTCFNYSHYLHILFDDDDDYGVVIVMLTSIYRDD